MLENNLSVNGNIDKQIFSKTELLTLKEYVNDPDTVYFWDIDGILKNSTKKVFEIFNDIAGTKYDPNDILEWDHLKIKAMEDGLSEDLVQLANYLWYDAHVLGSAEKHLGVDDLINFAVQEFGIERNFVLTSRNPNLKIITQRWFELNLPIFPKDNILIREDSDVDPAQFKADTIKDIAGDKKSVLIDDAPHYIKRVIEEVENCLILFVPQGKIMSEVESERLIRISRYPEGSQEIFSLYKLMLSAARRK